MKVIKRDGSSVDYDRSKIVIAIEKANAEVPEAERMSREDIDAIIDSIEALKRPRMLVEDIQDLVEQGLVERNKFHLAKTYIIYRYTRALVRKANTTDESILSLIRNDNKELAEENANKNTAIASTQRDYIAGEVSRDLTRRILLPEHISKAHDEGVIHFHDADYFVQHIFNCCLVNIGDMLDNGTMINGKLIESSAFNECLSGLTFLGYGMDDDGDPKNIYSIVQRLKDIAAGVPEGEDWDTPTWEEFDRLVGKLENASSEYKTQFTNQSAGTEKLKNNYDLLEDNIYNLKEQYSNLEDVNMADAISSFLWAEYCYNAALKVGNSILSQSLMDYLQ